MSNPLSPPTSAPTFRCWVGTTAFRKNNTPVLGMVGASVKRVVVMTADDFGRLGKLLPDTQFLIGDLDE